MIASKLLAIVCLLAILFSQAANGDDSEANAIRDEILQLKESISELQEKVDVLEQKLETLESNNPSQRPWQLEQPFLWDSRMWETRIEIPVKRKVRIEYKRVLPAQPSHQPESSVR